MRMNVMCMMTVAVLGLTASCSNSSGDGGADAATDDAGARPTVVASTDAWGSVAEAVGGDDVDVTSIISDPAQDPHSFEADTQTLLAVSKADVIIENGGGYDDFMEKMIDSSDADGSLLDAVEISGRTAPAGGELNEHVWYDLPTVVKVAEAVADELSSVDPDHATDYRDRAAAFSAQIDDLVAQEATLKTTLAGKPIAITEPVPLYLTEALGLVNETPEEFSEAIEEGDDVSVPVLKSTLDLFTAGKVDALVYNEQTSGPVTEQVETAATAAGVPVVPVTETLPDGLDFVGWMQQNITALESALPSS